MIEETLMRRLTTALLLLLLLGLAGPAMAQTVSVQQAAARLDASAVAFTQAAVAASSVATVVVPTGYYGYITGVSIDACENGSGGAITNANITSSGLSTNPSWSFSAPSAANTCAYPTRDFPVTPYNSLAGTNVVLTSPATTAVQYTIRVYYYLASQ
jgi:hypothetical protein